jgi:hypothetical protein
MDSSDNIKSFADLKKHNKCKQKLKLDSYEKILLQIREKITNASTIANQDYLIYQVPEVVIGLPFYEIKECCEWLKKKSTER